jgi:3-phosphoshikimate 1-carboxyvinyltransferase
MMEIRTIGQLDRSVRVPGSKSYTQRALVLAALAEGESTLKGALRSEDTEHLVLALRLLGAGIENRGNDLLVRGTAGVIANPGREIRLGNNGTAIRLLSGIVSLGRGGFALTGDRRLCERPIGPLTDALRSFGIDAGTRDGTGFPPVIIRARGITGGRAVLVNIDSSQYISSLLICGALAERDCTIEVRGRIPSQPYVDMTIGAMKDFGVEAAADGPGRYRVRGRQAYRGTLYAIEGDLSSASYFFLAAALCRETVRVENVDARTLQGDAGLLAILERLGVEIEKSGGGIRVTGRDLQEGPFAFDLGNMPDMVPTLAVLSAVRRGRTVIRNVAHLRVKESDRLAALVNELRRVGAHAEEREDGLQIEGGGSLHGAEIETYGDHRIAMSFAMLGLAVPGIRIADRACVNKSFPGFWNELERWQR